MSSKQKNSSNRNRKTYSTRISSGADERSISISSREQSSSRNSQRGRTFRERTGENNTGSGKKPRNKRNSNKMRQQRNVSIMAVIIVGLFVAAIIGIVIRKNGTEVFVADTSIGIVKNKSVTADDLKNTVISQLEAERGTKVQINEKIEVVPVHCKKKDIVTIDYVIKQIRQAVTYKVEAAVITADSAEIAVLNNEKEANELLQSIVAEYVPEGSNIIKEDSGFVQNVEVSKKFVDSGEIITAEEAKKKFTEGTMTQKAYTVASGDTLYKIATNADMTVEGLISANPGMTLKTPLQVGHQINILVNTPFLSVKTVENNVFTEKQPKKVEYRKDDTKVSNYRKVVQQGKDGQKEVTIQTVRINGFEDEQKVISERITVEPVTEIIVQGTR